MNDHDLHHLLDAWMDLGPSAAPVRVAEAARLEVRSTRQTVTLAGWTPPQLPFLNMATLQVALAAVLIVAVTLLGYRYLAGSSVGGPGIEDPLPSPTASSASPLPLAFSDDTLPPGRYALAGSFPVELTLDLPAGWSSCPLGVMEQGVCRSLVGDESGIGIAFLVVENVVADPCNGADLQDPPVGPTVEDLVDAVSSLEGFEATAAEDVTVDGYPARRLTVTAPDRSGCELFTWASPDRTNGVGRSEINDLHIVDVDGVRILISAAYFPDVVTAEDLAETEEVLASIQIEP